MLERNEPNLNDQNEAAMIFNDEIESYNNEIKSKYFHVTRSYHYVRNCCIRITIQNIDSVNMCLWYGCFIEDINKLVNVEKEAS